MTSPKQLALSLTLLMSLLLANTALVTAQDGSPAPEAAGPTSTAPGNDREVRTVYVPFRDLEEAFEQAGRGIFLPYDEFLDLWRRAIAPRLPVVEPADEPPVDWTIARASLSGRVTGKSVTLEGVWDIRVLQQGWVSVPLDFGPLAVEELAFVGESRGAVIGQTPSGRHIVVRDPGPLQLKVRLLAPVAEKPGLRSFSLKAPGAAVNRLDLEIAGHGQHVEVSPRLAMETTETDASPPESASPSPITRVVAYLGAGNDVHVTWRPEVEEVAAEEPLLVASTETAVSVEEGVVRTETRVGYRIHNAPARRFRIAIPSGWRVLSVRGENLRDYDLHDEEPAAGAPPPALPRRVLQVRLHSEVKDTYGLEMRLERIFDDATAKLEMPAIEVLAAERESGYVTVAPSATLRLDVSEQEGVSQVDAADLPAWLASRSGRAALGYRYLKHPWKLVTDVEEIEPELEGRVATIFTIHDEELQLGARIDYTIKRRGIFSLSLRLPADLTILDVGTPASVKDWRARPDPDDAAIQVLEVDLPTQTLGAYALTLHAQGKREAGVETLVTPMVRLVGAKKETGLVGVAAASHLKLTTGKAEGLLPVGVPELRRHGFPHAAGQGDELTLGFRYGKPPANGPEVTVTRREPKVTATIATTARCEEDLLRVEATVSYEIRYAGVDTLVLELPASVGADAKIEAQGTPGIKERKKTTSDDGKTVRWTLALQSKATDRYALRVVWETKLGELKSGESTEISLAALAARDVFHESGHIAIHKDENLVIEALASGGLEPVDVRELPPSLRQAGAFRGYKYVSHPYGLDLTVFKYDYEPVPDLVVNHIHLDQVLSKEQVLSTEMIIRMQNNRRQFLTLELPAGSSIRGVRVAGNAVFPSKGEGDDVYLVDLAAQRGSTAPFLVHLVYETPLGATRREPMGVYAHLDIPTPRFPPESQAGRSLDVPVARLTRRVYLPNDMLVMAFDSNMRRHFVPRGLFPDARRLILDGGPRPGPNLTREIQALRATGGGSQVGLDVSIALPADIPYSFSKLDQDVELRVRLLGWKTLWLLEILVLAGVMALGIWLVRSDGCGRTRYILVAAAVTLVVQTVAGEAATQLLGAALTGLGLLALGWCGRWLCVVMPRAVQERRLEVLEKEAVIAERRAMALKALQDEEAASKVSGDADQAADKGAEPPADAPKEPDADKPEAPAADAPTGPKGDV